MLHKNKELIKYLIVIIIGIVLWYILGVLYLKIQVSAKQLLFPEYDIYRALIGLALTLIGILIEWETLLKIFKDDRTIKMGLLLFAIILIVFPIVPYTPFMKVFGIRSLHSVKGIISLMYEAAYTRSAMSILGGILLVRSFKKI